MRKKGIKFLKNNCDKENYEILEKALKEYNPEILEKKPTKPNEIYQSYVHIDQMFVWLKNAYQDDLCVLGNEMRAILGHLSEYGEDEENLEKAYGHLRRLSIDTLKIVCNAFDKEFDEWIKKHSQYDYRGIDSKYFPQYVKLYNCAHRAYIEVQKDENLGSDRKNNIIVKYHTVGRLYGALYRHHVDERRIKIEKITRRFKINRVIVVVSTVILTTLSILGTVM